MGGGGEGRSKGHTRRSPTGVLAKGGKTRRRRKPSNCDDHSPPGQRPLRSIEGLKLAVKVAGKAKPTSALHDLSGNGDAFWTMATRHGLSFGWLPQCATVGNVLC